MNANIIFNTINVTDETEKILVKVLVSKGDKGNTGDKGEKGETGKGIENIKKIKSVGLIDTYKVTYTDGDTFEYEVTNGEKYNDSEIKKEISKLKTNYYRVVVNELIQKETEYELPFEYEVGVNALDIFYNSERLIREDSEEQEAHFKEIGQKGEKSNKVMFGWNIPVGRILDFIVRGGDEDVGITA